MSGGASEIHRDLDPLVECTHNGANGATAFLNRKYNFLTFLTTGISAENETQSTIGNITVLTANTITVSGVTWNNGDTLKVYKTATKGSTISSQWVDLSRGWKTPERELSEGWRPDDVDEDRGK